MRCLRAPGVKSVAPHLVLAVAIASGPAVVAACSAKTDDGAGRPSASSGSGGSEPDASTTDACIGDCSPRADAGDAGCNLSQLPLIVDQLNGVATRLHVPIQYKDAPV